jgi:hypothetical protein
MWSFNKDNSVWIGGSSTAATFTNTFSQPVNDMVYNLQVRNDGEVMTITVNSGTVSITYIMEPALILDEFPGM